MNAQRPAPQPAASDRASQTRAAPNRRDFVKLSTLALAGVACGGSAASASEHRALDEDRRGVLVDLTVCVGCRRCEWACAEANGHAHGALHEYDDESVFESRRAPAASKFTVVNRVASPQEGREPIHLKVQCMHCERPACVSACLVGAMQKHADGPVTYDASRCIGCRYCMVACPFGCLGYEYERKLTPRVSKCGFCHERTGSGKLPACVEICPVEAMTYGPRRDLLALAHQRIADQPDRYVDHVYGESEAGGTSWLYLSPCDFGELGLPSPRPASAAALSEAIQHGIFRGFAAPLALGGLLAVAHRLTQKGGGS